MTHADFYVKDATTMEWVGSVSFDGYPHDADMNRLVRATSREGFLSAIEDISNRDDYHAPADGYPWKWNDSNSTDWTYVWTGKFTSVYEHGKASKKHSTFNPGKLSFPAMRPESLVSAAVIQEAITGV